MSYHITHSEFPRFIKDLPKADYSDDGGNDILGYVAQSGGHQVVFNENEEEMEFTPHVHAQSFGVVLQGWCDLIIDGDSKRYHAGETYHVPEGVRHFARQSANYKDIVIFNEKNRVPVIS
ncbi:MAG: cupin domain-containing protein [Cocleimonas sp.]